MSVSHILATKGADVVTTRPNRTLLDVAAELTRRGIGVLVVVDAQDDVVGLIAERDIVGAIAFANDQQRIGSCELRVQWRAQGPGRKYAAIADATVGVDDSQCEILRE